MNTNVQIHPSTSFPFQLHDAQYGRFVWLKLNEQASICISSVEEANKLIAALIELKAHFEPTPCTPCENGERGVHARALPSPREKASEGNPK